MGVSRAPADPRLPPHRGRLKALVTDLDGTLADLGIDWDSVREEVRSLLRTDHPLRPLGPSIPLAAGSPGEAEAAFRLVEEREMEAASRAAPDPALRGALERIRRMGLRVGLVTLQARRPAREALRRLGVADLFDALVTREFSASRVEQFRRAAELLGASPGEAVLVGDSPWDVEAGREAGAALTVVVGRGARGDLNVGSFLELPAILARLMAGRRPGP